MANFKVYIIRSQANGKYYYRHTSDLEDRLKRHNEGRNIYTRNKGPWDLVTTVTVPTKSEAYKLEMKIKKYKNPAKAIAFLKRLNSSVV